MKTKLIILLLALVSLGCDSNEQGPDCSCETVIDLSTFNIVNPVGSPTPVSYYAIWKTRDCEGIIKNYEEVFSSSNQVPRMNDCIHPN